MLSCTCILFNLHVCRDFLSCEVSPLLFCFIFNNLHMDLTASLCPSFLCSASLHRYPCTAHLSISPSMVHIINDWSTGVSPWVRALASYTLSVLAHLSFSSRLYSVLFFYCVRMPVDATFLDDSDNVLRIRFKLSAGVFSSIGTVLQMRQHGIQNNVSVILLFMPNHMLE